MAGIAAGVICRQLVGARHAGISRFPVHDSYGADGANPSLLIGADIADPISGCCSIDRFYAA